VKQLDTRSMPSRFWSSQMGSHLLSLIKESTRLPENLRILLKLKVLELLRRLTHLQSLQKSLKWTPLRWKSPWRHPSFPILSLIFNYSATLGSTSGFFFCYQEYQASANGKEKDKFGRADCRVLKGPFYGVKVKGALFHTQGGLRVDFNGKVLKKGGGEVKNLYAGGGVAAGISGHGPGGYLSGNGLLTAMGYGFLAGSHVSKLLAGKNIESWPFLLCFALLFFLSFPFLSFLLCFCFCCWVSGFWNK